MPMLSRRRFRAALTLSLFLTTVASAAGTADAVGQAKAHLAAGRPGDAVLALEPALPDANGDPAFLDTLRTAYAAELAALEAARVDPARVANVRTKLQLLGGAAPVGVPVKPVPAAAATGGDSLKQATDLFKLGAKQPGKLIDAAKFFAAAFKSVELTPEQLAAWAYCRVRVAHDRVSRGQLDAAQRQEVLADVDDALRLAPQNAALQELGRGVMVALQAAPGTPTVAAVASEADVVETANFRVRHGGQPGSGQAVAQAAEEQRAALFARWSSGPAAVWGVKCEVVLHATEAAFAQATHQPANATGHATVKLSETQVTARRLDLRLDDPTLTATALPRELMNVVLADLFPFRAPPAWAEVGLTVLATSPTEQDRYRRTAERCAAGGRLIPLSVLFAAKSPPAERVTEFHVGSVSVVAYLVGLKGEKEFVTFLNLLERYGVGPSLKRVYGVADVAQLEAAWGRGLRGGK